MRRRGGRVGGVHVRSKVIVRREGGEVRVEVRRVRGEGLGFRGGLEEGGRVRGGGRGGGRVRGGGRGGGRRHKADSRKEKRTPGRPKIGVETAVRE